MIFGFLIKITLDIMRHGATWCERKQGEMGEINIRNAKVINQKSVRTLRDQLYSQDHHNKVLQRLLRQACIQEKEAS